MFTICRFIAPVGWEEVEVTRKEAGKKEEATEKFNRNSDTSREERKCLCGQEQKRKV